MSGEIETIPEPLGALHVILPLIVSGEIETIEAKNAMGRKRAPFNRVW